MDDTKLPDRIRHEPTGTHLNTTNMPTEILLEDQKTQVTVSEIQLDLSEGEFHGNIDFTITFDGPAMPPQVAPFLKLHFLPSSLYHAETLDVVGFEESEKGFHVTMYWETVESLDLQHFPKQPPQIELSWIDGETQSMGRFHVTATGLDDADQVSTKNQLQRVPPTSTTDVSATKYPSGIFIQELPRGLSIFIKWLDRDTPFTLLSGVLFAILPTWFFWDAPATAVRIFGIFFSCCGAAIFYYGICKIFNRTTISIENETLSVSYGPLPCPNFNKPIPTSTINSIRTKKREHRSKNQSTSRTITTYSYAVQAVISRKEKINLVSFDSPETATMIKEKLQDCLDEAKRI